MCSGDAVPFVLETGVPVKESAEPRATATLPVFELRAEPKATAAIRSAQPSANKTLRRACRKGPPLTPLTGRILITLPAKTQ